ncbi:hypothetical protein BGZ58_000511 [Dissophora ornata]|nr:hypothetical protein BGZ58_000511 [Dissophora ornata]
MEEAAVTAAFSTTGASTAVGSSTGHSDTPTDEAAYEIEEEFLPATQRKPKRQRFNFDEDD